jgi:hypothetical protein
MMELSVALLPPFGLEARLGMGQEAPDCRRAVAQATALQHILDACG